jgi:hypothetical protein
MVAQDKGRAGEGKSISFPAEHMHACMGDASKQVRGWILSMLWALSRTTGVRM